MEVKTTSYVFMVLKDRQTRHGSGSHTLNADLSSKCERESSNFSKMQAYNHTVQKFSLLHLKLQSNEETHKVGQGR